MLMSTVVYTYGVIVIKSNIDNGDHGTLCVTAAAQSNSPKTMSTTVSLLVLSHYLKRVLTLKLTAGGCTVSLLP